MKTTTLIVTTFLLVGAATLSAPAVAAEEDLQCVIDCDWLTQAVKDLVHELDPRNWPCTCDPQPDPGP